MLCLFQVYGDSIQVYIGVYSLWGPFSHIDNYSMFINIPELLSMYFDYKFHIYINGIC